MADPKTQPGKPVSLAPINSTAKPPAKVPPVPKPVAKGAAAKPANPPAGVGGLNMDDSNNDVAAALAAMGNEESPAPVNRPAAPGNSVDSDTIPLAEDTAVPATSNDQGHAGRVTARRTPEDTKLAGFIAEKLDLRTDIKPGEKVVPHTKRDGTSGYLFLHPVDKKFNLKPLALKPEDLETRRSQTHQRVFVFIPKSIVIDRFNKAQGASR